MFLVLNALTGKTEVAGEAQVRAAIAMSIGIEQVNATIKKMQDGKAVFGDERAKTISWVWTREEWSAHLAPAKLRQPESVSFIRSGALEGA